MKMTLPLNFEKVAPIFIGALISISIAQPFGDLETQFLQGYSVAKILLPALLIGMAFIRLPRLPAIPVLLIPLCLFVLWSMPSLSSGTVEYKTQLTHLLGYIFFIILIINTVQKPEQIEKILAGYCLSMCAIGSVVLLAFYGVVPATIWGHELVQITSKWGIRVLGTTTNPNTFALFATISVPIALHLFYKAPSKIKRSYYSYALFVFFVLLFLSASRSATLCCLFTISSYYFLRAPLSVKRILKYIPILLLSFVIALNHPATLARYYQSDFHLNLIEQHYSEKKQPSTNMEGVIFDKNLSIFVRKTTVIAAADLIRQNPLSGIGYNNFWDHIKESQGYKQHLLTAPPNRRDFKSYVHAEPHNVYLSLALYYGVPALILFVIFHAILAIKLAKIALDKTTSNTDRHINALMLSMLLMIHITYMFHDAHINIMFWLIIGLSIAVARPQTISLNIYAALARFLKTASHKDAASKPQYLRK